MKFLRCFLLFSDMSEHSCVWFLFIYILSGHANRWLKIYTSAATEAADIFHVLFSSEQLVRRMFKLSFKLNSPKLHSADIVLSRAKKKEPPSLWCGAVGKWSRRHLEAIKLESLGNHRLGMFYPYHSRAICF